MYLLYVSRSGFISIFFLSKISTDQTTFFMVLILVGAPAGIFITENLNPGSPP